MEKIYYIMISVSLAYAAFIVFYANKVYGKKEEK